MGLGFLRDCSHIEECHLNPTFWEHRLFCPSGLTWLRRHPKMVVSSKEKKNCQKSSKWNSNMPFCYFDYVELKALKQQQRQGEAFSKLPFICLWQTLQKELNSHKSLPGEFHQPGKMVTGEDTRNPPHTETNAVRNYHIFHLLFKGPSTFLLNCPFPIKKVDKLKSHLLSRYSLFFFPVMSLSMLC